MAENYDGWYDKFEPKMSNFEVPHHSKYSSIEGIWQLEYTRDKLAKYGLKDPWMRNEIWRYPKWFKGYNPGEMLIDMMFGPNFKSFKRAFLLTAAVLTAQNIYWRWRYGQKPLHRDDLLDWLAEYDYARTHPNQ